MARGLMCDLPLQLLPESSCPVDVTLNLVDVGKQNFQA